MKISKDILGLLINKYFDNLTLYNCQFVSKTIYNFIGKEKLRTIRLEKAKHDFKTKKLEYEKQNIKHRLEFSLPNTIGKKERKKLLNNALKHNVVVCEKCELYMLSNELNTHNCILVNAFSSIFCKWCNLYHYDFRHYPPLKCSLQIVECGNSSNYPVTTHCDFRGPYKEVLQHRRTCVCFCTQCETELVGEGIDKHFFSTTTNDPHKIRLVCKKLK